MAATSPQKRRRIRRGASVDAPHGFWGDLAARVSRPEVLARLGICAAASLLLVVMLRGWEEPFSFRLGSVPPRGLVSRVAFEKPDPDATRTAQERAAAKVRVVYAQDKAPVVRLRDGLKNRAAELAAAETLNRRVSEAWLEFAPEAAEVLQTLPEEPADPPVAPEPPASPEPPADGEAAPRAAGNEEAEAGGQEPVANQSAPPQPSKELLEAERAFQTFRGLVDSKDKLLLFDKAIDLAFQDLLNVGVLEKIQHAYDEGSQNEIDVHPIGNAAETTRVQVSDVVLVEAKARLKTRLKDELGEGALADRIYAWVEPRLSGTLEIDRDGTDRAKREAIAKTPPQFVRYAAGDVIAEANAPVLGEGIVLLRREHDEYLRQRDTRQRLARTFSMLGLFAAMFALSGFYIHLHHRKLLDNIGDVLTLVGLSVVTVVLCMLSAHDAWQAEIVPLLIFAMTVAISYDEDLALLIAAQVALVVAQGMDWGLASFVTLTSAAAAMIFWMGRIRNRSKLIYVGLWAGVVATLTQLGTGLLQERSLDLQMLYEAGRTGVWTLLAGFLMTGLLPFIERTFGVLTDLSLLEVGDVAHPLLQELVRRAPGTYNHSINVASLAEAAAEAIGARGLLRGESGQGEPPRVARSYDEHAHHRGPREGRRGARPPVQPAPADHRPDRRAPRHHAGRVLLSPRRGTIPLRSERRGGGRADLPLPGAEAEHPRVGRDDALRRRGERQPHAHRTHPIPDRQPRARTGAETAARRAVRRVRPDAGGTGYHRAEFGQEPDGRVSRAGQISRPTNSLSHQCGKPCAVRPTPFALRDDRPPMPADPPWV